MLTKKQKESKNFNPQTVEELFAMMVLLLNQAKTALAKDIKEVKGDSLQVAGTMAEYRKMLEEKIEDFFKDKKLEFGEAKESIEKLKQETLAYVQSLKPEKGDDGKTPSREELLNLIEPLIPEVEDGEDADPEEVADLVHKKIQGELKKIGDLEQSLRFLNEELEQLQEDTAKKLEVIKQEALSKPTGRIGMRKVPIVRRINLTDQVNGNTKSFVLPKDTVAVLGVWGTQFPITFDEADFTLVGNTLTLTDEVAAPETGQTLVAIIETLFYA